MADNFDLTQAIATELKARLPARKRKLVTIEDDSQWQALYDDDSNRLKVEKNLLLIPRPNISFFYQLEITDIDLLIIDNVSASIGLVKSLPLSATHSELLQTIDDAIDVANYLRHLIMDQQLKFHVELLLAIPESPSTSGTNHEARQESVVAHLSELIRQTNYLHSLGVNILHFRPDSSRPFDALNFDKSFCWLLLHYQEWMAKDESHSHADSRQLSSLKLKNFKSWINQKIELNSAHNIHLVHGNNGTGKSTLAEAIELLLTNDISRLNGYGSPNFPAIIKNYNTGESQISLEMVTKTKKSGKGKEEGYQINPQGLWQQGDDDVAEALLQSVENFRLDQPLMSKLIDCSNSQRTDILLNAFFPKQADMHRNKQQQEKLTENIKSKLSSDMVALKLPEDGTFDEEQLLTRLDFVKKTNWQITVPEWEVLFGIALHELEALAELDNHLQPILQRLQQPDAMIDKTLLNALDKALSPLKTKQKVLEDAIETSLVLLNTGSNGVAEWRLGAQSSKEPPAVLLNKWLEAWIYTEMDKQALATAQSVRDATQGDWTVPEDNLYLNEVNYSDAQIKQLKDALEQHTSLHDALDSQVASLGQDSDMDAGAQYKNTLLRSDIDALNLMSDYLDLPEDLEHPLGTVLAELMSNSSTQFKGSNFLLKNDWAKGFYDKLLTLKDSVRALTRNQMLQRVASPFSNQLSHYGGLVDDLHALQQLNQIQGDSLFSKLQELAKPLNELLALTTSASWQYKGIELRHSQQDGEESTRLDYGDTNLDASAILNTAELNLFTVCLFFICAPRLDNPLRLLLLDDPLQNMDELTVTTLARALGRVFRLWEHDKHFKQWQVMFLFHGQDDMERFVQEVYAARYQLPWLNKQVKIDDEDVTAITAFDTRSEFDVHKSSFDIKKLLSKLESLDFSRSEA